MPTGVTLTAGTPTNVSGGAASVTVAVPTCVVGDVLLAVLTAPGNRTVSAAPTGWTPVSSGVSSTGVSSTDEFLTTYSKVADATDAAGGVSYTWTWSLTGTRSWSVIIRCQGVDKVTPTLGAVTTGNGPGTATTFGCPAVSGVAAGRLVTVHSLNANNAGTPVITPDAALTPVVSGGNTFTAAAISTLDDQTSAIAYLATSTLAGRSIGQSLILRPANIRGTGSGRWGVAVHSPGSSFAAPYDATNPKLTWSPPDTTGYTTVHVSDANHNPTLDPNTDYKIVIDSPITALGGLVIDGGRNVVLIGGEIDFSNSAVNRTAGQMRGLLLQHIRDSVYVEGLWIHGTNHLQGRTVAVAGALGDAINVNDCGGTTKAATITIQNVRAENVRVDSLDQQNGTGTYAANTVHPDVLQWYGTTPNTTLRVDKLTGITAYQGFFVQAGGLSNSAALDMRRVNIDAIACRYDPTTPDSAYLVYRSSGTDWRATMKDVYLLGNPGRPATQIVFVPDDDVFNHVIFGAPAQDYVPIGVAGMNYVSPGYVGIP